MPTGFLDLMPKRQACKIGFDSACGASFHGENGICAEYHPKCGDSRQCADGGVLSGNEREQLVNRMLCSEAMIDAQKLRTGELEENDWAELINAMGPLSEAPIYIDDNPRGGPRMEVRSKCRRLKVEKGWAYRD